MRALFSSAMAVVAIAALNVPAAAQGADAAAGKELALRVCDACHVVAAHQEMAAIVPGYGPSFFDIAKRPGTSAQSLAAFLAHPHAVSQMPFPHLTAVQIANVSAYIVSLRGRH